MGSLEVYYGTIALIIALIELARGYARALGSTMIIMVAIFLLLAIQEPVNPILIRVGEIITGEEVPEQLFLSIVYQLIFTIAVFAGYSGRTINFSGRQVPPPQGTILSILIGMLNGYLVAGTLWYYQHLFQYPFQMLDLITPVLTPTAEALVGILPQILLPSPALWMFPIAVLLLLRVRG